MAMQSIFKMIDDVIFGGKENFIAEKLQNIKFDKSIFMNFAAYGYSEENYNVYLNIHESKIEQLGNLKTIECELIVSCYCDEFDEPETIKTSHKITIKKYKNYLMIVDNSVLKIAAKPKRKKMLVLQAITQWGKHSAI